MRLAEPGQALHQHVAAGENRGDDAGDQVPLTDDDAIEGRADRIELLLGPGERRLGGRGGRGHGVAPGAAKYART